MIFRCRASVKNGGAWLTLAALAGCGNHGAPPYAPETTRAAMPAAAPAPSDPRAVYDLREKCGADARQWYQHVVADDGAAPNQSATSHGFTSHYNLRSNDCFALATTISRGIEIQMLANVLENREIGVFSYPADPAAPLQCHVAATECRSRDEWQSLTSAYMND